MKNNDIIKKGKSTDSEDVFLVEHTNGGLLIKKEVKGFFKKKLIEVKEFDLFNTIYQKYIGRKYFEIIPTIEGLTLSQYLIYKNDYFKVHGLSDYGRRVFYDFSQVKIDNIEEIKQTNGVSLYVGDLKGTLSVKNTSGEELLVLKNFGISICELFKPTIKYYESLFTISSSGIYQTVRDAEAFYKELYTLYDIKENLYNCDICGEQFNSMDEFFAHIIENKHHDSVLDVYKYDEECIRIKKLLLN